MERKQEASHNRVFRLDSERRFEAANRNKQPWSLTMRMATKQASVVFQSPLAVAEALPTSML